MQTQPRLSICHGFGVPKGLLYILLSKKDYLLVLASIVTVSPVDLFRLYVNFRTFKFGAKEM